METMSASVLVTGGAGFIGSHLVERLAAGGRRVVCLDAFDPYYPEEAKRDNLRLALAAGDVSLREADIRDTDALRRVFREEEVQTVVHLAARPGVRPSLEDAATYLDINVSGTLNLLNVCREFGVPRFVFASSSSVYGQIDTPAAHEDSTPCRPLSPYGASKVAAEALCSAYANAFGLTTIALRFFTVYGPRQRPDMAICRFTRLMAEGQEIPIYGDGSSLRDYTFVSDTVSGLEAATTVPLEGLHVLNLGQGRPVKLDRVVQLIEQNLGVKARLNFLPTQVGDPYMTCADISRAAAVLGYSPAVSIEEGIAAYARWFKEKYGVPSRTH